MLKISNTLFIPDNEIEYNAIRAQGSGGQNVNKVSSAINLRFDIVHSSLSAQIQERLLQCKDYRISSDGIINIKAQRFRSQEKNKADAQGRLIILIQSALVVPKKRKATKPSKSTLKKRIDQKTQRGQIKKMRSKLTRDD